MNDGTPQGFWVRIMWFALSAAILALVVWGLAGLFGYSWEHLMRFGGRG